MAALSVNPRLLATVNAWLGAPLVAQNGERFEDCFGKVQQVHQDGSVEGLANVVPIRLVSWQKLLFLELLKDVLGLGIRFDTARWQKLRLQDHRNAARRTNDNVRPQCRLAEDALLLHAGVIAPARMLGSQYIQQSDIEGDFAGSGHLNIQLQPLWFRLCDFPIR